MGQMGSFNCSDMRRLQNELEKLQQNADRFLEECAKELAARLLRKVIKRTPVGDYSKEVEVTAKRDSKNHKRGDKYTKRVNPGGKQGGTLRRGWTGNQKASARAYIESTPVHHFGGNYVIELTNPVEYASYVEYGHRTANHKGWVQGRFMMTISEQEIRDSAPQILEKKIQKLIRDAFG